MNKKAQHLETLEGIRNIMEKSTRFMTLSGKSGISIGIVAVLCAATLYLYLDVVPFENGNLISIINLYEVKWGVSTGLFIILLGLVCIILALSTGFYFTMKESKKVGASLKGRGLRLMMINLAIPLVVGGIFSMVLIDYGVYDLVGPSTLIFYGLALINGGKYTLHDIHQLGIWEIILGVIAMILGRFQLEFWVIGFGILHILYGIKINRTK